MPIVQTGCCKLSRGPHRWWCRRRFDRDDNDRFHEPDFGRYVRQDVGRDQQPGYEGYGRDDYRSGSHAGKGPKGYQRSNERVKEEVCDRLESHGNLDASEIEVVVKDGEVTLTGTVCSRDEKREAENCAESVTGVRDVNNRLKVDNSKGSQSGKAQDSEWGSQNRQSKSKGNV